LPRRDVGEEKTHERESLFSSTLRFAVASRQLRALRAWGGRRRETCVGEEVVGHKKSDVWMTKSVRKMYTFTQKKCFVTSIGLGSLFRVMNGALSSSRVVLLGFLERSFQVV